jgi:hypothetical protein
MLRLVCLWSHEPEPKQRNQPEPWARGSLQCQQNCLYIPGNNNTGSLQNQPEPNTSSLGEPIVVLVVEAVVAAASVVVAAAVVVFVVEVVVFSSLGFSFREEHFMGLSKSTCLPVCRMFQPRSCWHRWSYELHFLPYNNSRTAIVL